MLAGHFDINDVIPIASYCIGIPLEVMVIAAMLRSRASHSFPFIFIYSVALFPSTITECALYLVNASRRVRAMNYWINEGILQFLTFAAVLSMIYLATATMEKRTNIRRALLAGAILFAVLSVAVHYEPGIRNGRWLGLVTRDLNFCSAILDLALWTMLIAFQRQQHRLLMLSGGLGVKFTGTAIGYSLRELFPAALLLGNIPIMVANLGCLYIWWQTFRVSPVMTPPQPLRAQSER